MMEEIFKETKFGDKFITRDQHDAVFLYKEVAYDNSEIIYYAVSRHVDYRDGSYKDYSEILTCDKYGYRNKQSRHEDDDDIIHEWF